MDHNIFGDYRKEGNVSYKPNVAIGFDDLFYKAIQVLPFEPVGMTARFVAKKIWSINPIDEMTKLCEENNIDPKNIKLVSDQQVKGLMIKDGKYADPEFMRKVFPDKKFHAIDIILGTNQEKGYQYFKGEFLDILLRNDYNVEDVVLWESSHWNTDRWEYDAAFGFHGKYRHPITFLKKEKLNHPREKEYQEWIDEVCAKYKI